MVKKYFSNEKIRSEQMHGQTRVRTCEVEREREDERVGEFGGSVLISTARFTLTWIKRSASD
jgi:hypothetical protein